MCDKPKVYPVRRLRRFTRLQITACQWTMSSQNWVLTGQILGLPDMVFLVVVNFQDVIKSCCNCSPFKVKWKLKVTFLWGGWKITKLVFSILRESLFAQSQELTLESSLLIVACREVRFLCLQNKLVSSANKWKSKTLEQWWKSLIYNKKRIGPRTDPWGTPHEILTELEVTPFTVTVCREKKVAQINVRKWTESRFKVKWNEIYPC